MSVGFRESKKSDEEETGTVSNGTLFRVTVFNRKSPSSEKRKRNKGKVSQKNSVISHIKRTIIYVSTICI